MNRIFSNLKGDAFGGITAGIVALPLALAFGVSSGLGPSAGLYGAIFLSFFASLFGGTNTQISGPTAPMVAISMVIISSIIGEHQGDVNKALPSILTVFIMAGFFQVLLGILGLGKYIKYIPYPVVSGFMTAIGVIILITQILPAIGYYPKEDEELINGFKPEAEEVLLENILKEEVGEGILVLEDFTETIKRSKEIDQSAIQKESQSLASDYASGVLGTLKVLPSGLKQINWLEVILALSTILIIYGFKRITTAIPSTLVALLIVSGVAYGVGLNYRSIEEIPSGFPILNIRILTEFNFGNSVTYVFSAITLALLGVIDSLLTSVVADNMTKTRHNPNKELIGQGIGNTVAAFFGGISGAGATIRTVVNIKAGGKTKLSGMISGMVLLMVLLVLGPIASKIPAAVLSGILITVGIGVMDAKGLKAIPSLPRDMNFKFFKFSSEVLIMVTVLLLSTFWNLVNAVGVGLIFASLIFMKKIGDFTIQESSVRSLEKEKRLGNGISFPEPLKKEVFVKDIKGPLFFGSTSDFQILAKQIPQKASILIIRMRRMPYIDQSGLYTIEDILMNFKNQGKRILFVGVLDQPRYMLERIGIIPDLIPNEHIFRDLNTCLDWVKENV